MLYVELLNNMKVSLRKPPEAYLNLTISLGVQLRITHSFSNVSKVIFLFFFKASNVLLSIPCCRSLYWETPFAAIVSQRGV